MHLGSSKAQEAATNPQKLRSNVETLDPWKKWKTGRQRRAQKREADIASLPKL